MGRPERKAAEALYRAAHDALHDNQAAEQAAGVTEETDEYLRLNAAAVAASKDPDLGWFHRSR